MAASPYFPHTREDIASMLGRIGASSVEELYSDVPREFLFNGDYDLPSSMSEEEVRRWFEKAGKRNRKLTVFTGCGAYDHHVPSAVPYIASRSEFLTAYTPYQSEISQGTLRYIFEFQSMICALTGMDAANASLYDGPTAAAEAMMMSLSCTRGKSRVLCSSTLLPNVREVLKTYASFHGIELALLPAEDGQTSLKALEEELSKDDVAALIAPSVNRFGIIEDHGSFAALLHDRKALLIEYCDPSSLAVLKTPAEWGADIAVGDAQTLGIPLSFGGPYVGFMAVRSDYLRKMPGRIVGQTVDRDGKRAFVLTLQAREQHIRRQKATSNICSNQSLMALYVTVYLSLTGPEGLRKVNELSSAGARYLHGELLKTGKFEEVFAGKAFLKEFVLRPLTDADVLRAKLLEGGFLAATGTEEGYVSFCVTEKRTKEECDELVKLIRAL